MMASLLPLAGPAFLNHSKEQLKIGGRLVIPVGRDPKVQELVRVTRISENEYASRGLSRCPVCSAHRRGGMAIGRTRAKRRRAVPPFKDCQDSLAQKIADSCEPFESIETAPLDRLLARIGDARVVLLGKPATVHWDLSSRPPYFTRADREEGLSVCSDQGTGRHAARVDHYVRHMEYPPSEWTAFARFPTWMWRDNEVRAFVDWLRAHNAPLKAADRAAFHGLDLYSLYDFIRAVRNNLDEIDPSTAADRTREIWLPDPLAVRPRHYGHASVMGGETCEWEVTVALIGSLAQRRAYAARDGERFFDAAQNCAAIYVRGAVLSHHV